MYIKDCSSLFASEIAIRSCRIRKDIAKEIVDGLRNLVTIDVAKHCIFSEREVREMRDTLVRQLTDMTI